LISLAVLLVAGCVPATPAPATPAPTVLAGAPAVKSPVPAPAGDNSRPLAKLAPADRNDRFSGPAAQWAKPGVSYVATIVTAKGKIVAELYPDAVAGVNNFVTLALGGFYDGLTFHRVEPGFVIQGGDPKGDGTGGPGYTIPAEINHKHLQGALAWARRGDDANPTRASSGSQFYITLDATPFLDGGYSVFGQVIEGMEVAAQITANDKIERIDITQAAASRLPTPAPTPLPKAPKAEAGRPLAKLPLAEREKIYNTPPAMTIDVNKKYQATIKWDAGEVVADLDVKTAPNTVNNFVMLADLGYFDGMPVAFIEPESYAIFGSPASQPDSDVGYIRPAMRPALRYSPAAVSSSSLSQRPRRPMSP
jgi:cyclophilin family peptidyl-prolyl cis-trans isomerase